LNWENYNTYQPIQKWTFNNGVQWLPQRCWIIKGGENFYCYVWP
jgi:hypothetical protein